jgi:cobalt-zinc-cadmium efflux system membrane fusion protein
VNAFGRLMNVGIAMTGIGISACENESASDGALPAHVDHAVAEAELTRISLTTEAAARLGVETAAVERRNVAMTRMLGGELLVPPGHVMTVAAPTAGIVLGPQREAMLPAGAKLEGGDVVMELLPLPPDSELLAAREDIPVREAEVSVARARAERAAQLLQGRSGSQEQLEQAQAELVRAEAALRLARSQQSLLLGADASGLTPITLVSQEPGVLAGLHVASGQLVSAGAPLFTVEGQDRLWVRVPVYSSDQLAIDPAAAATIAPLGGIAGAVARAAQPVAGPPTANPDAASVDLFYEIDNADRAYRAGQRVQVGVSLRQSGEQLVVPWSAILQDIHGGSWVYVQAAPRVYERTRVSLQRVLGDIAVLERGPEVGTEVVSVGVAELAGTEFGVAH